MLCLGERLLLLSLGAALAASRDLLFPRCLAIYLFTIIAARRFFPAAVLFVLALAGNRFIAGPAAGRLGIGLGGLRLCRHTTLERRRLRQVGVRSKTRSPCRRTAV